ncbi:hypothetical protein GCM10025875_23120 [Litorihabitans aurantiacus]|uniref:Uncharacterized protein n=1 Tax=Litorihabitans aurantiacus TaxID=1930061 RepID=A0AA38CUS0_9MICO|nr:hypothetical protein GCM10025875_23120 [Litorihabitans aurantiacus]
MPEVAHPPGQLGHAGAVGDAHGGGAGRHGLQQHDADPALAHDVHDAAGAAVAADRVQDDGGVHRAPAHEVRAPARLTGPDEQHAEVVRVERVGQAVERADVDRVAEARGELGGDDADDAARPRRSDRASGSGPEKPSSRAAASTRSRVAGETGPDPENVRDAVEAETPARRATSASVARRGRLTRPPGAGLWHAAAAGPAAVRPP